MCIGCKTGVRIDKIEPKQQDQIAKTRESKHEWKANWNRLNRISKYICCSNNRPLTSGKGVYKPEKIIKFFFTKSIPPYNIQKD